MSNGDLNRTTNYIWGIADDVLRYLYMRGKYRDVSLWGDAISQRLWTGMDSRFLSI